MIRNRAFQGGSEFPSSLDAWVPVNDATLSLKPLSKPVSAALPNSVNVKAKGEREAGLSNKGWWGIDVQRQKYTGSFYVKGRYKGVFKASLKSTTSGETLATARIDSKSVEDDWVQHHFTLMPRKATSNTNNTFSITFDPKVFLFPWV